MQGRGAWQELQDPRAVAALEGPPRASVHPRDQACVLRGQLR